MNKTTISDITLYELMGENFSAWLGKNKKFGYDLFIEGFDKDSPKIEEEGIHPCAIDSFADFCKQFLYFYNKINNEENNELSRRL